MTGDLNSNDDLIKDILKKIKRGHHIVWFNTNKGVLEKAVKLGFQAGQKSLASQKDSFDKERELWNTLAKELEEKNDKMKQKFLDGVNEIYDYVGNLQESVETIRIYHMLEKLKSSLEKMK